MAKTILSYILLTIFLNVTVFCKQVNIFDAVRQDSETQIQLALDEGVDINSIGPGGQTPLMHAVLSGKVKFTKQLSSASVWIYYAILEKNIFVFVN